MSAAAVATAEQYSDTNGRDIRSERKYARTQATGENYYYYSMSMLPCWRSTRFKLYVYTCTSCYRVQNRQCTARRMVINADDKFAHFVVYRQATATAEHSNYFFGCNIRSVQLDFYLSCDFFPLLFFFFNFHQSVCEHCSHPTNEIKTRLRF